MLRVCICSCRLIVSRPATARAVRVPKCSLLNCLFRFCYMLPVDVSLRGYSVISPVALERAAQLFLRCEYSFVRKLLSRKYMLCRIIMIL